MTAGVSSLLFLFFRSTQRTDAAADPPAFRRRSAGVPNCSPHLPRTCSALAPHLLRTCAALVPHLCRTCAALVPKCGRICGAASSFFYHANARVVPSTVRPSLLAGRNYFGACGLHLRVLSNSARRGRVKKKITIFITKIPAFQRQKKRRERPGVFTYLHCTHVGAPFVLLRFFLLSFISPAPYKRGKKTHPRQ